MAAPAAWRNQPTAPGIGPTASESACPCVLRAAPLLAGAESRGAERALSPPCRQETRAYPKYFSCDQEGSRDQPESESSVSQPSAFKEHLLYTGTSLAAVCGEGEDHSGSCVSLGKTGTTEGLPGTDKGMVHSQASLGWAVAAGAGQRGGDWRQSRDLLCREMELGGWEAGQAPGDPQGGPA